MVEQRKIPQEGLFLRALTSFIKPSQASAVIQHARMQYQALYTNKVNYHNTALQNHLESSILPGIALYQSLLAYDFRQEEALIFMKAAFREWSRPNRRRTKLLGRLPFYFRLMKTLIKPMMKSNFPEIGWKIDWVEHNQDVIAFDIKGCFYQEVLTEYDVPELTALYCRMDDLIHERASPYVKWDRTKTLGRGDEYCDFRFIRVKPERKED